MTAPTIAPMFVCLSEESGRVVVLAAGTLVDVETVMAEAVDEEEFVELFPRKAAASAGLFERNAAMRSEDLQLPLTHGLDLQHPMNGGSVAAQEYQFPDEHCWSGIVP